MEKWVFLDSRQRALYRDVMQESYKTLMSLKYPIPKADMISRLEPGEEPWVPDLQPFGGGDLPRGASPGLASETQAVQPAEPETAFSGSGRGRATHKGGKAGRSGSQLGKPPGTRRGRETPRNGGFKKSRDGAAPGRSRVGESSEAGLSVDGNPQRPAGEEPHREHGANFSDSSALLARQSSPAAPGSYPCPACEENFIDASALLAHQRSHAGQGPGPRRRPQAPGGKRYRCSECGERFRVGSHLATHLRLHTGVKPFRCADCGKGFDWGSHYARHRRLHTGERPFQCADCGKCFGRSSHLYRHQRAHADGKPLRCPACGKAFNSNAYFLKHRRAHAPPQPPHRCSECGETFPRRASLAQHRRSHRGEKPFRCEDCGKAFAWSSHLERHRRVHTGERPHACGECGEAFSQRAHLVKHRRVHAGGRASGCPACGKSFGDSSALEKHRERCRPAARRLAVESPRRRGASRKSLAGPAALVRGRKSHAKEPPAGGESSAQASPSGENPRHPCPDCGKNFLGGSQLERHRQLRHAAAQPRPFRCEDCGKSFSQAPALARHQQLHVAGGSPSGARTVGKASPGAPTGNGTGTSTAGKSPSSAPAVGSASGAAPSSTGTRETTLERNPPPLPGLRKGECGEP